MIKYLTILFLILSISCKCQGTLIISPDFSDTTYGLNEGDTVLLIPLYFVDTLGNWYNIEIDTIDEDDFYDYFDNYMPTFDDDFEYYDDEDLLVFTKPKRIKV